MEKRTELSCKKELERGKRHIAFSACSCRPEPQQQQPAVYRVAGAWQAAAVSAPLPFATEENLSKVCNVDGPWSGGGIGQAAAFAVVLVCRHENNWKARTTRTTTTVQGCRSLGGGHGLPGFDRSVYLISIRMGADHAHFITSPPPLGFSDLPTTLLCVYCLCS